MASTADDAVPGLLGFGMKAPARTNECLWPDIDWSPRADMQAPAGDTAECLWPDICWTPRAAAALEGTGTLVPEKELTAGEMQTKTKTKDRDAEKEADVGDAVKVCLWPDIIWTPRSSDTEPPPDSSSSLWPDMNW
mmetsp:Transcript_14843/g.30878  ORF Transcript_14843/g.30878 Transcript_14843/m.30878 type:complete len:136 (+) Transcript_14843:31-438(+)